MYRIHPGTTVEPVIPDPEILRSTRIIGNLSLQQQQKTWLCQAWSQFFLSLHSAHLLSLCPMKRQDGERERMSFFSCSLQLVVSNPAEGRIWCSGQVLGLMVMARTGEPPFCFAQPSKDDLSAYDSELHLINIAPLDPVTVRQPSWMFWDFHCLQYDSGEANMCQFWT